MVLVAESEATADSDDEGVFVGGGVMVLEPVAENKSVSETLLEKVLDEETRSDGDSDVEKENDTNGEFEKDDEAESDGEVEKEAVADVVSDTEVSKVADWVAVGVGVGGGVMVDDDVVENVRVADGVGGGVIDFVKLHELVSVGVGVGGGVIVVVVDSVCVTELETDPLAEDVGLGSFVADTDGVTEPDVIWEGVGVVLLAVLDAVTSAVRLADTDKVEDADSLLEAVAVGVGVGGGVIVLVPDGDTTTLDDSDSASEKESVGVGVGGGVIVLEALAELDGDGVGVGGGVIVPVVDGDAE